MPPSASECWDSARESRSRACKSGRAAKWESVSSKPEVERESRETHGGEELSLARERDVHGTVTELAAVLEADDIASGCTRRALEVSLVEGTTVGAAGGRRQVNRLHDGREVEGKTYRLQRM